MAQATCNNLQQVLITQAGLIGPTIYNRTLNDSPWRKLVKQEPYIDELGATPSVLVYERSLPTTPAVWQNLQNNSLLTGDQSTCVPQAAKIALAQTLRQYNLQQTALESPDFCLNDLRFAFQRQEQLKNVIDILAQNSKYLLIDRYRDEYTRLAQHKICLTPALPESSVAMPLIAPTAKLNQRVLDRLYLRLRRDGGGNNPMDRDKGAPVFLLITDSETSDSIIRLDDATRQDFRFSSRVNEYLAPLGVDKIYHGYFHVHDDFSPRWDFVNGAWVRRLPYTQVSKTQGIGYDIDPIYEAAAYTDSFIFHIDVFSSLIPRPINGLPGNMSFADYAQNYSGDFVFRNILDRNCNPDGNIGYFRALFATASKPIHPEFGYVIRHQRCAADLGLVGCTSS